MIAKHVHILKLDTWVNTHNLFHVLGRAWALAVPIGDLHYRLNLFCAFLGTVTVSFVFWAGFRLTRNLLASIVGAVALMFSHSLWWHSTILEVYTLNTALLAVMLYFIVRFNEEDRMVDLYGAVFTFGLACSNHVLMGLFLPAFLAAVWVSPQRSRILKVGTILILVLFFLAGFSLYLFVFFRDLGQRIARMPVPDFRQIASAVGQMIDGATGGHFRRHMFPDYMPSGTRWNWRLNYLFLLLMNYPSAAFVAGWAGLVAFSKMRRFRFAFVFFLVGLLAQAIWSSNYLIWDMYAFGLPVWVLFGFLVILGFDLLYRRLPKGRLVVLALFPTLLVGPIVYARIPTWASGAGFWQKYFRTFDYVSNLWDPARYFANPNKRHYDDVERIAQRVFEILPPGAHLYDDDGKGFYPLALYYRDVLGARPDIRHHLIFGPELDDARARAAAEDMRQKLEAGEAVFISSPYWPERPVLNHLYRLLAEGMPSSPERLSVAELEGTFPRYELRRIPLIDGKPYFIYRLTPRSTSGS